MKIITKEQLIFLLFFLGIGLCICSAQESDKLLGTWINDDHSHEIKFHKTEDGTYEAFLWEKGKNGKKIIKELQSQDGEYNNGKVYSPKNETWFDCSVSFKNDNTLLVTGKKGWFSRTKEWTRTND
ncbi:DUF2147 domain-containing protein [Fulvivirga maritima]|uniref:DUF2147 domain-containing protein n=1 Tax=Fulvivirga maritima TaxID=2904247 RepID=UPI001F357235|nr:DUF2147 domain-containing protein [Fulvivirga maritima]UII25663.1 DUF2147 domain-containing protein [Fulvivirga maritima]